MPVLNDEQQLAYEHGELVAWSAPFGGSSPTGWWSPGCDIQRSPFSGRNGDYYSQDAMQGGLILAAVCEGAEENGLACWIKHFVLNDMDRHRIDNGPVTWSNEQALREIYARAYEILVGRLVEADEPFQVEQLTIF